MFVKYQFRILFPQIQNNIELSMAPIPIRSNRQCTRLDFEHVSPQLRLNVRACKIYRLLVQNFHSLCQLKVDISWF